MILPDRPPATVQERPAATELEQPPATVQEQPATTMQEQPTVMQEQPTGRRAGQRATPQRRHPHLLPTRNLPKVRHRPTVPASGNGGTSPATKARAAGTRPLKAASARTKASRLEKRSVRAPRARPLLRSCCCRPMLRRRPALRRRRIGRRPENVRRALQHSDFARRRASPADASALRDTPADSV